VLVPGLSAITDIALGALDRLPRDGASGRVAPQRTSNRLAALFLDSPARDARSAMTALRFSKYEINWTAAIVERWAGVGQIMAEKLQSGPPSDAEVRRWLAALGRLHAGAVLRVAEARWCAMREAGQPAPSPASVRSVYRRLARSRFGEAIDIGDLAVGGDELRAAGIPAGPIYAKILSALLELVLETPARNTPEALLAEVPRIVAAIERGADPSTQP
jgi:hypothetical protein